MLPFSISIQESVLHFFSQALSPLSNTAFIQLKYIFDYSSNIFLKTFAFTNLSSTIVQKDCSSMKCLHRCIDFIYFNFLSSKSFSCWKDFSCRKGFIFADRVSQIQTQKKTFVFIISHYMWEKPLRKNIFYRETEKTPKFTA